MPGTQRTPITIKKWVWRALFTSTMIPLLLVETALVAVYFLSNNEIRDANLNYLQAQSNSELNLAMLREAKSLNRQLEHIQDLAQYQTSETYKSMMKTQCNQEEYKQWEIEQDKFINEWIPGLQLAVSKQVDKESEIARYQQEYKNLVPAPRSEIFVSYGVPIDVVTDGDPDDVRAWQDRVEREMHRLVQLCESAAGVTWPSMRRR